MSDKLQELISRCRYSVMVTANDHRDYYQSVSEALKDYDQNMDGIGVDEDIRAQMIELEKIISVQFYPENPNSFYIVLHFDLELALDMALECLGEPDD